MHKDYEAERSESLYCHLSRWTKVFILPFVSIVNSHPKLLRSSLSPICIVIFTHLGMQMEKEHYCVHHNPTCNMKLFLLGRTKNYNIEGVFLRQKTEGKNISTCLV